MSTTETINPAYRAYRAELSLNDDPRGNVMLGVGILWLGCGIAAMAKMVSFEI